MASADVSGERLPRTSYYVEVAEVKIPRYWEVKPESPWRIKAPAFELVMLRWGVILNTLGHRYGT